MAFFNDLVRTIAKIEGMEEMTVRGIGLSVRDAGHITKGGRGLSAAKMTIRDAANLLIGVNASYTAKSAGKIVEHYRECVLTDKIGLSKESSARLSTAIRLHERFGTFLEAVIEEHMIADEIDNSIRALIDPEKSSDYKDNNNNSTIEKLVTEVIFLRPEPEVDVDFVGSRSGQSYGQIWFMGRGPYSDSDRRDSTRITTKTLVAVAKAISN